MRASKPISLRPEFGQHVNSSIRKLALFTLRWSSSWQEDDRKTQFTNVLESIPGGDDTQVYPWDLDSLANRSMCIAGVEHFFRSTQEVQLPLYSASDHLHLYRAYSKVSGEHSTRPSIYDHTSMALVSTSSLQESD